MTKRDEIVKAATSLIAERTLPGFNSKDVLERVDCSEALIYKNFPSKDALITGCFDYLRELDREFYEDELPLALKGETDPVKAARKSFITFLRHHHEYIDETRFYFEMVRSKRYDLINPYLEEIRETYLKHFFDGTVLEPYEDKIVRTMSEENMTIYLANIVVSTETIAGKEKMNEDATYEVLADMFFNGIDSITVMK